MIIQVPSRSNHYSKDNSILLDILDRSQRKDALLRRVVKLRARHRLLGRLHLLHNFPGRQGRATERHISCMKSLMKSC